MDTTVITTLLETLYKSINILKELDNASYCSKKVGPYYSSIGSHIRHVLDFYNCIFRGLDNKHINLTSRERNQEIENNCDCAILEIDMVSEKLKDLSSVDLSMLIDVEDNLGNVNVIVKYTLGGLLAQANGHTIHHYAIIGYIMDRLDVVIKDENFGYNPTTPQKVLKNSIAS